MDHSISNPTTPFVILGHGEENIMTNFTDRTQLTPGYILVTLAECGAVTTEDIVTKFVNAFKQPANANTFADPIHHTKQIETLLGNTIHIYLEGDFIPNLTVQTFLDWEGPHDTKLMKSGLYRFPLNPMLFTDPLLKAYPVTIPYSGKIPAELPIHDLFHESIYPTHETIVKTKLGSISEFKKSVTFPLRDILLQGGPGVYYYVICRAPFGFNNSIFNSGLLDNNISEKCKRASNIIPILPNAFDHFNRLSNRAKISNEERRAKGQKPLWWSPAALRYPSEMRNLYTRTMNTRRRSANQQTRRKKSKSKSKG